MKSTVAALSTLAAVASAYSPHQRLHFPRGANATTTTAAASGTAGTTGGGNGQTTLTVIATQVETIISCAPTVTNCPANHSGMSTIPEKDKTTIVVTKTVDLTTTVCPVSEATKISASLISKHSTAQQASKTVTTAVTPSAPASNGGTDKTTKNAAVGTSEAPKATSFTTVTTDIVTERTVTVTVGTGTETSAVATVITDTVKSTITVPCTNSEESTSTTTATSTKTRTITVDKPAQSGGNSSPGNPGAEACVPTTVTETVTAPASTVYVTMDTGATKVAPMDVKPSITNKPSEGSYTSQNYAGGDKSQGGDKNQGGDKSQGGDKGNNGKGGNTSDCPPDETITKQTTVTVVPYPTKGNNGTNPVTTTSGAAAPTGYARLRR